MWKSDKHFVVTASDGEGNLLNLKYKVLDTDVADRWLDMIERNESAGNKLRNNYRRILSADERLDNFGEFRNNILAINLMYDRVLDDIISLEHLHKNQDVLNDLHEEYEIYGDRLQHLIDVGYFNKPQDFPGLWMTEKQNFNLHERFLRLNEQIHNFEAIFRTWDKPNEGLCTCLVDHMPAGIHEPLKPEDFFLFETDLKWGWMYLGYNTLGKHWSSVMNENDIDVVRRDQVRPQARFASEFYMHFGRPTIQYQNRVKFYNWWVENNISDIKSADMTLKELALGYIPVATVIAYQINDNEYINIPGNMPYDQTITWNVAVWSKFNTIIKVSVVN